MCTDAVVLQRAKKKKLTDLNLPRCQSACQAGSFLYVVVPEAPRNLCARIYLIRYIKPTSLKLVKIEYDFYIYHANIILDRVMSMVRL